MSKQNKKIKKPKYYLVVSNSEDRILIQEKYLSDLKEFFYGLASYDHVIQFMLLKLLQAVQKLKWKRWKTNHIDELIQSVQSAPTTLYPLKTAEEYAHGLQKTLNDLAGSLKSSGFVAATYLLHRRNESDEAYSPFCELWVGLRHMWYLIVCDRLKELEKSGKLNRLFVRRHLYSKYPSLVGDSGKTSWLEKLVKFKESHCYLYEGSPPVDTTASVAVEGARVDAPKL